MVIILEKKALGVIRVRGLEGVEERGCLPWSIGKGEIMGDVVGVGLAGGW